jgi:hypothetical protein
MLTDTRLLGLQPAASDDRFYLLAVSMCGVITTFPFIRRISDISCITIVDAHVIHAAGIAFTYSAQMTRLIDPVGPGRDGSQQTLAGPRVLLAINTACLYEVGHQREHAAIKQTITSDVGGRVLAARPGQTQTHIGVLETAWRGVGL